MAQMLTIGGKAPSLPGTQYGSEFMYPGQGSQGGGSPSAPGVSQHNPPYGAMPTWSTPTVTPVAGLDTTINAPTGGGPAFGGNMDWGSMIGGSWEVGDAEAAMAEQMARGRSNFQTDIRQAFTDLGLGDTSGLGDNLSQYIDKDTIQNAVANKYSTYAQIANQVGKATNTNNAILAARGGLASGLATNMATELTGQAEQARYTGLRDFLQQGRTGLTHLGDLQAQLSAGVAQARSAAAARLAQMYAFGASQPSSPYGGGPGSAPSGSSGGGDYWANYPGGIFPTPWLAAGSGIVPGNAGGDQPYWVGPGSGGIASLGGFDWKPHI